MNDRMYNVWLVGIEGIGSITMRRLLERFGSAEDVYRGIKAGIQKGNAEEYLKGFVTDIQKDNLISACSLDAAREYESMISKGIRCATYLDEDYPKRLRDIPDPPAAIYYLGRLPEEKRTAASIIGARKCSNYGREVAMELGRVMASKGIAVISGMAAGIDGIGQGACLSNGGQSFAVLGSGVDVCYPKSNRDLYEKLIAEGGVLSEYKPGTLAKASLFPPRNRLVSGLSDAVIVVEAGLKSGTLITVDMALEQGRDVHVVPGRITDRLSDGCNCLMAQGATVVLTPEMTANTILNSANGVRTRLGLRDRRDQAEEKTPVLDLHNIKLTSAMKIKDEQALDNIPEGCVKDVFKCLGLDPLSCEDIDTALQNKYPISEIRSACLELVLINMAIQVSPGHFVIRR